MPDLAKPSAPTISAKLVTVEPETPKEKAMTFVEVTITPAPQTQRFTNVQIEQRMKMRQTQMDRLQAEQDADEENLALFP
jgi:hypothetical protein